MWGNATRSLRGDTSLHQFIDLTFIHHSCILTLGSQAHLIPPATMSRPSLHTEVYAAIAPEALAGANRGKVAVVTGAAQGKQEMYWVGQHPLIA
jgi:hypothetical protein